MRLESAVTGWWMRGLLPYNRYVHRACDQALIGRSGRQVVDSAVVDTGLNRPRRAALRPVALCSTKQSRLRGAGFRVALLETIGKPAGLQEPPAGRRGQRPP